MVQEISSEWRKARKAHPCDYCGEKIMPGEKYLRSAFMYDGEVYTWKEHKRCHFIAQEIWEYCDPDEGMTHEEFCEGCMDICRTFVCPDCDIWDKEDKDCREDYGYCLDRLYELFQTKELYRDRRDYEYLYWKMRDRKGAKDHAEQAD